MLQNIGISDIDGIKRYSKYQWKRLIRSKIREENRQEFLENIKKYKKLVRDEEVVQTYVRKLIQDQTKQWKNVKTMVGDWLDGSGLREKEEQGGGDHPGDMFDCPDDLNSSRD